MLRLKKFSDKITVALTYVFVVEIAIAVALAINFMYDYHFFGSDAGTYTVQKAMSKISEQEYEDISKYLTLQFQSETPAGLSPDEQKTFDYYVSEYSPENTNIVFKAENKNGDTMFNSDESFDFDSQDSFCYREKRSFNVLSDETGSVSGKVTLCVRSDMTAHDNYYLALNLINIASTLRYAVFVVLFILICVAVFLLGWLMYSVGKPKDSKKQFLVDKIPFDVLVLMVIAYTAFTLTLILLTSVPNIKETNIVLWNAIILILEFFQSVVLLVFCISLASRIKSGSVLKNTVPYRIISRISKKSNHSGNIKIPFIGKTLIAMSAVLAIDLAIVFVFVYKYKTCESGMLSDFNFLFFAFSQVGFLFVFGAIFFLIAFNLNAMRENSKKIASGDYGSIPDSHIMFGDFRAINDDLIAIKDEMINALEEKNRSTEMRNELIANISHDIKTPLTSIINYSDIVSSGGCNEEEINNYLGIIKNQSQKLNNLLQNLIEVSKVSAGTIQVYYESLDIGLYLTQVVDEFSPMFAEKNLTPVLDIPDESVFIECDSSMLWRVFENLINNICSYAMPDTRVFIDVRSNAGKAEISLKNTSANKITLTEEELVQRFKRNDKSRRTVGNGLGLSIAKSFTEVQRGRFDLVIDGDLFKTVLTFNETKKADNNR